MNLGTRFWFALKLLPALILPCSVHALEIQSPRTGSDLQSLDIVLLLKNCRTPSNSFFRVFLDGQPLDHSVPNSRSKKGSQRARELGEHALAVQLPRDIETGSHRLTAEASCGGQAQSDSILFTFQKRSILETAQALAQTGMIELRSDRAPWGFSQGLFAWGLVELSQVSDEREARLLRDWVQGYHFGWAQRSAAPGQLDTPLEVFPALSGLLLGQASFASVQAAADFLKNAPRNSSGLLDRRGTDFWRRGSLAGISAEEMLGYLVFAAHWAQSQSDIEGLNQIAGAPRLFANLLWDPKSGLYHQTWLELGNRVRNQGGGFQLRTQASVLLALVSLLELVPENSLERASLVRQAQGLAHHLSQHSLPVGAWSISTEDEGLLSGESTTTALIGAAFVRGVRLGVIDPQHLSVARSAWNFLLSRVVEKSGSGSSSQSRLSVDQVISWPAPSRGVRCLKEDLPHAVGAFLLFAAEWTRLGG